MSEPSSSGHPPSDACPPAVPDLRGIWFLAAGQVLAWAGLFYSFAALLLTWERSQGWQKTELALGFSVAVLVSAVTAPLVGGMIDAGHGRRVLCLGPIMGSGALVLLASVQTEVEFGLVWLIIGLAQAACLYEACFALVTLRLGAAANVGILRIALIAGLASPLAFLLAATIGEELGWRTAVLVLAALVAVGAAPLNWIGVTLLERGTKPPRKLRASDARHRSAVHVMRSAPFLLVAMAFTMASLNHGILLTHIVPLVVDRGVSDTMAFVAASLVGPMQVIGRLAILPVAGRVSSRVLACLAFLGLGLASLALLASRQVTVLVFVFAGLQGAAYGLTSILRPSVTAETMGRAEFGTISGWLALPCLVGFAVAPTVSSRLWQQGGYDLAITVALCSAAIGLGCLLALRTEKWR